MRHRPDAAFSSTTSLQLQVSERTLPAVAEDGMLQQLSGGRPVGGLKLKATQGDVSQAWRQVGWDSWCCGSAGNLREETVIRQLTKQHV